jgi:hypothetical protein
VYVRACVYVCVCTRVCVCVCVCVCMCVSCMCVFRKSTGTPISSKIAIEPAAILSRHLL